MRNVDSCDNPFYAIAKKICNKLFLSGRRPSSSIYHLQLLVKLFKRTAHWWMNTISNIWKVYILEWQLLYHASIDQASFEVAVWPTIVAMLLYAYMGMNRLTRCGLVTPYGGINMDQHGLQCWLAVQCPNHYLDWCWSIIIGVLWHSSEIKFRSTHGSSPQYVFGDYILKNTTMSLRCTSFDSMCQITSHRRCLATGS